MDRRVSSPEPLMKLPVPTVLPLVSPMVYDARLASSMPLSVVWFCPGLGRIWSDPWRWGVDARSSRTPWIETFCQGLSERYTAILVTCPEVSGSPSGGPIHPAPRG